MQLVEQSGPQIVERGSSVKLNCSLSQNIYLMKPSLTWIKIDETGVEHRIYPSDGSLDTARFHVDPEAFKMAKDAGILLRDLRGQDSGRYVCIVTILQNGMADECRGAGTDLIVQATMCDTVIACFPLGVFIVVLLVLHGMVYKQWTEYMIPEPQDGAEDEQNPNPTGFLRLHRLYSRAVTMLRENQYE
ncbi:uncharacterized protein [Dendropsophus ebraccatus]